MVRTTIEITNPEGLHVKPAAILSGVAQRFQSQITMIHEYRLINVKSLMNILSGSVRTGTKVAIEIEGPDEKEAMEAIIDTIKYRLEGEK
ncbi:hypothetical protein P261_02317 [Lachnospiraceae bacterium TWA4]|nr:hypothetical protein P261_02317 [Lachnospiraceae bacterium TWA4]